MIAGIVLTFNSQASIQRTLDSLKRVTNDIYIIDSFSTDKTQEICAANGCRFVQRPFTTYFEQRNWAIENFGAAAAWQLHLDADEELDEEAIDQIGRLDLQNSTYDGYIFLRRLVFMNKMLRFGGISKTWHMRLFRTGTAEVEHRLYDQHFLCRGPTKILAGSMIDHQEMSLSEWTARHNRWSDMEARAACTPADDNAVVVKGNKHGTLIEKKRYQKETYYNLPIFLRVFIYFAYRYIFKLGFLDGIEGLIYHFLQGFWFRFIVDSKIYEIKKSAQGTIPGTLMKTLAN